MAREDLNKEQRDRLIKALREERDRFNNDKMPIHDHVAALSYLFTGAKNGDEDNDDIYYSAINDTEQLYNDYCH